MNMPPIISPRDFLCNPSSNTNQQTYQEIEFSISFYIQLALYFGGVWNDEDDIIRWTQD